MIQAGLASTNGSWDRVAIPMSVRVGGQFSSTRSELLAIAEALRCTGQAPALAVLVDSAAALQRLAWYRSSDFRPSP